MKIESVKPPPPPRVVRMTFSISEGWALLAALQEWIATHPHAAHVEEWREWAAALDKEVRQ